MGERRGSGNRWRSARLPTPDRPPAVRTGPGYRAAIGVHPPDGSGGPLRSTRSPTRPKFPTRPRLFALTRLPDRDTDRRRPRYATPDGSTLERGPLLCVFRNKRIEPARSRRPDPLAGRSRLRQLETRVRPVPAPAGPCGRPASPRARLSPVDAARTSRPHRSGPIVRSRHRQADSALCHCRGLHARGDRTFFVFSENPVRGRLGCPVTRTPRPVPAALIRSGRGALRPSPRQTADRNECRFFFPGIG